MVTELNPVPPLATGTTPEMVFAEFCGADELQVVPLDVNTLPVAPGATTCKALAPLPNKTLLSVNVVAPVPPLATATVPVTLSALPVIFPETLLPATPAILASMTAKLAIFPLVIALSEITGAEALELVPARSPLKAIFPFTNEVASGAPEVTLAST